MPFQKTPKPFMTHSLNLKCRFGLVGKLNLKGQGIEYRIYIEQIGHRN